MGDFPPTSAGSVKWQAAGSTSTGSKGATLTAHATPNTENASYTQIIASTAFDAAGFYLQVRPRSVASAVVCSYLTDIAFGSSGNERDIITDLYTHRAADTDGSGQGFNAYFPIPIPAGTRLSGRVRADVTVEVVEVIISLHSQGFHGGTPCGRVTTYGQDTTDSGALLTQGTAIDTLAWTQFSASLTNDIRYLYLSVGYRVNTTASIASWLLRVARGASGAEANNVMFGDFLCKVNAGSDCVLPSCIGPVPVSFKAGDRLAVGVQCSQNDGNDRQLDVQVIGVD